MIVGTLSVTLTVHGSQTLKDKRQVVRSILDTARNRFNVSAAEIGSLDSPRAAKVAFACVSNDRTVVNVLLDRIRRMIESNPLCEPIDSSMEIC